MISSVTLKRRDFTNGSLSGSGSGNCGRDSRVICGINAECCNLKPFFSSSECKPDQSRFNCLRLPPAPTHSVCARDHEGKHPIASSCNLKALLVPATVFSTCESKGRTSSGNSPKNSSVIMKELGSLPFSFHTQMF